MERLRNKHILSRQPLSGLYICHKLCLVLNIDVRSENDKKRARMGNCPSASRHHFPRSFILYFNAIGGNDRNDWQEQPMFVEDVQSVNGQME